MASFYSLLQLVCHLVYWLARRVSGCGLVSDHRLLGADFQWAASFDSMFADVGNSLVCQLGRYLRWPRFDPVAWRESHGRLGSPGHSRPSPAMAKPNKGFAFCAHQPSSLRLPWLRGFCDVSSFIKQMPVYTMQSRCTAPTPLLQTRRLHLYAWQMSHTSSLRQSHFGLRAQTANQPKFIPSIISAGQLRH